MTGRPAFQAVLLTAAAMLAFAGNSLLCRLALKTGAIDPASFTAIRLASGALVLAALVHLRRAPGGFRGHGSVASALALFAYAAFFSFAYVTLDAASGALLLFGFVQATMIVAALAGGERPVPAEIAGWTAAAAGVTWLLLPGAERPAQSGTILMAAAGIAWGVYSLRGRRAPAALPASAANFLIALAALPLLLPFAKTSTVTVEGAGLAVASGAVTSGLGYVLWYAALRGLTSLEAALVQLSVPALTAAGGVLLLAEPLDARLLGAGSLVLGGIAAALAAGGRRKSATM